MEIVETQILVNYKETIKRKMYTMQQLLLNIPLDICMLVALKTGLNQEFRTMNLLLGTIEKRTALYYLKIFGNSKETILISKFLRKFCSQHRLIEIIRRPADYAMKNVTMLC